MITFKDIDIRSFNEKENVIQFTPKGMNFPIIDNSVSLSQLYILFQNCCQLVVSFRIGSMRLLKQIVVRRIKKKPRGRGVKTPYAFSISVMLKTCVSEERRRRVRFDLKMRT